MALWRLRRAAWEEEHQLLQPGVLLFDLGRTAPKKKVNAAQLGTAWDSFGGTAWLLVASRIQLWLLVPSWTRKRLVPEPVWRVTRKLWKQEVAGSNPVTPT